MDATHSSTLIASVMLHFQKETDSCSSAAIILGATGKRKWRALSDSKQEQKLMIISEST